jgi:hypothetical protein
MGHAVEICSNSAGVLAAAAKLWSCYPVLSHAEPIRIRVIPVPPDQVPRATPDRRAAKVIFSRSFMGWTILH